MPFDFGNVVLVPETRIAVASLMRDFLSVPFLDDRLLGGLPRID